MEKYGEFLFEASSDNIKECLGHITVNDIESCCEYKIFNRGYDYYQEGTVEQLWYNSKANTISAEVIGTREYDVEIYLDNEEVHGTCSCEYYGVCKHIIAVLLNIAENGTEHITENDLVQLPTVNSLDFLKSHLKKLPKEELINLVMKFAPENYILQIHNSKSDKKDANKIFAQAEKKILGFFKDQELLWDPSGMESALMGQSEKLKGLESQISEQIGELLLKIMIEINDAFDEGYLYIDNYYNEDYFESPQFDHFVISYIRQLPFTEKIDFLQELDSTLGLMSYSTFEGIPKKYNFCFSNEESKKLAELVASNECKMNDSLVSELFGIVEEKLGIEEKERILTRLSTIHQDHLISLIELLIVQDRHQQAYDRIEMFLSGNPGHVEDKIIELYLDLCIKIGSDLKKAATVSINHNPNEKILLKIKALGIADTKPFEDILMDKNPHDLLSFFEREKRLQDALDLILNTNEFYDETIFSFFKRNKKLLTSEAEQYFLHRIDKNMANTGDSYYSRIAETIGQIKQINPKLAKEIVTDIRVNYKRRTKLMGMLRRY